MSDETYNGWKNVETWVVNLWLNNDRGYYETVRRIISDTAYYNKFYRPKDDSSVHTPSMRIETMVRKMNPINGGMFADIINHSLNQVDWLAIAEGFKDD